MRSLALRALLLFSNSLSVGIIALLTTNLKSGKYSFGILGNPLILSSILHTSLKYFLLFYLLENEML